MARPSWDATWMALAVIMSQRSKCPSGPGAVIADRQQRVIATGYAGPPARFMHDPITSKDMWSCEGNCPRQTLPKDELPSEYGLECPTVHAEQNAIIFADRSRMEGGTFYISSVPCEACAKIIANSGVSRVVWRKTDADKYRGWERQYKFLREECRIDVHIM